MNAIRRQKKLLDEILDDGGASASEEAALHALRDGLKWRALSARQLEQVEHIHHRLGLGAVRRAENLVSSGVVEAALVPFESFAASLPWGEKAMAPPGRALLARSASR